MSRKKSVATERQLENLISVGPAMLRDFEVLGIRSIQQLAKAKPNAMYKKLCRIAGQHQDICVQDVLGAAVAKALEGEAWAAAGGVPRFIPWRALWWQARPGALEDQIIGRRKFLESELAREQLTLEAVLREVGHPHHEAVWMITLMIEQFKTELAWLAKVESELPQRGLAKNPDYASPPIDHS